MKKETSRSSREAMGCFLMLVLGAIACVGVMRVSVLAITPRERLLEGEWWQSLVLWLIAPGAASIIVAWFTYGFDGLRNWSKRG